MALSVAGVDGCRGGWVVVVWDDAGPAFSCRVAEDFDEVLAAAADARVIGIDIPIGLLDHALPGGRVCDVFARRLLHPCRTSSVFSPPVRSALDAPTYAEALAANRASSHHGLGLSQQCFGIAPKIREVDRAMTPELQARVREVHPEISFQVMNHGAALTHPKRTLEGRAERLELAARGGFAPLLAQVLCAPLAGAGPDDLLDACAACWSARRIAEGLGEPLPREPRLDARGLRMAIWF